MTTNSALSDLSDRVIKLIRLPFIFGSEKEFNQLALDLFAFQFEFVPAYRRLCQSRQMPPGRISDWGQIPFLPASAFKEFEVSSLPEEQRTRVFFSSGTTGQRPGRHFHNAESLRLYEIALLRWFGVHLFSGSGLVPSRPGEPTDRLSSSLSASAPASLEPRGETLSLIALTPPGNLAPNSSLVYMFETIRRRFQFSTSDFFGSVDERGAWILDAARATEALGKCVDREQPVLLLGAAFSFVHLLDHMTEARHRLLMPRGSRAMETGGYKGRSRVLSKQELRSGITRGLGIPGTHIVSEYGMSELSSQAYDRTVPGSDETQIQNLKSKIGNSQFPPWARAQIISPETGKEVAEGETGLIRILDLANLCSVAAIQTEDLAIRRGTGFELMGRAAQAEPRGCSLMMR